MKNKEYEKLVEKHSQNSNIIKNCTIAFIVGGAICAGGQLLFNFYSQYGNDTAQSSTLVSITLIAISFLLTGFNIYHKIADKAGAGTLIPITGFANAVVSPAIEFRAEGLILGVGAKIFSISGPVIVYGPLASAIYGLIFYFFIM